MNEMDMEDLHRIVRKLVKNKPFRAVASESIDTQIGPITIHASELGVISVDFGIETNLPLLSKELLSNDVIVDNESASSIELTRHDKSKLEQAKEYAREAAMQLSEYFLGKRIRFTVPLLYEGTNFQKAVWQALLEIPYGETRTYKDIAIQIGSPKAVRAVGQANRANPIAIIVPCHRVIGAHGGLVGYAGSQIGMKSMLLELEQRISSGRAPGDCEPGGCAPSGFATSSTA